MKKLIAVFCLPVVAGCLTASVPAVSYWTIDYMSGSTEAASTPSFGAARILQVAIRAPYDNRGMAVMRQDGSLTFDPINQYAAMPAQLLRNVVSDALDGSGRFEHVVGSGSLVNTPVSVEAIFLKLVLNCREENKRQAEATILVRLIKDRQILAECVGDGMCDAANGDYGKAFSSAVSQALNRALERVK